jgi:capsular polysaccharide biosynthesis protein
MQPAPPFPTFALGDAPEAPSLAALIAEDSAPERRFTLYPETVIDPRQERFADLWHYPANAPNADTFRPGPLTSAPVFVRVVTNALIHPRTGVLMDRAGRVCAETLGAERFRDPALTRVQPLVGGGQNFLRQAAASGARPTGHRTMLYANHGGYTVFGHLIGETIPIALLCAPWLRSGQMKMLMPMTRSKMPNALLDLAGLSPDVQVMTDKDFMWVQRAIVSSTCSAQPTFAPGPMMRDFARTILATVPVPAGQRRLYLTRAGERTTQQRDLTNEADLIAALAPLGFEAVNPGLLPARQQVALFAQADCLVAMMGSVWANLIYARPDCLVVDLLPVHKAQIGDRFGLNAAKAAQVPYILILSHSEGPRAGDIRVTADVPLIVDRVRRGLERLGRL